MSKHNQTERRKTRVRLTLKQKGGERPRLSVFRSSKQIYAQVIDDTRGVTVAAASSLEKDSRSNLKTGATVEAAKMIGELVARRAVEAGISEVVFDRGGYMYHGRIKALADGAREGGLKF